MLMRIDFNVDSFCLLMQVQGATFDIFTHPRTIGTIGPIASNHNHTTNSTHATNNTTIRTEQNGTGKDGLYLTWLVSKSSYPLRPIKTVSLGGAGFDCIFAHLTAVLPLGRRPGHGILWVTCVCVLQI